MPSRDDEMADRKGTALRSGDTVDHFDPIFGDRRGTGTVEGFRDGKVLVRDSKHGLVYTYEPEAVEKRPR